ncbi:hypothetical protein A262_28862 [Pseudomonas syringae pv. actinidiae ICMP 19073]|nr:hypothetical protein A262_28862 [Pseudomonas syringae pv. actinidiae ICMP 19073]
MHMRRGSISHFLKSSVDVAVIKFMVAANVGDVAAKRFIGPLHAPCLFIDITTEDYQVDMGIKGRRIEEIKFVMEV